MAQVTSNETPSVAAAVNSKSDFFKRQLHGAAFLSLEHFLHMALVVAVTFLVIAGAASAISMWVGDKPLADLSFSASLSGFQALEAMSALGIVAGLIVLVPMLVLLSRRVSAELVKRNGYEQRLAYKVPVYGALALFVIGKTVAYIAILTALLQSVAMLGVADADVNNLYLTQLLPAVVAAVVIWGAGWYVFKLTKGEDKTKLFTLVTVVVSLALAIALFITAYLVMHAPASSYTEPSFDAPTTREFDDLFNY